MESIPQPRFLGKRVRNTSPLLRASYALMVATFLTTQNGAAQAPGIQNIDESLLRGDVKTATARDLSTIEPPPSGLKLRDAPPRYRLQPGDELTLTFPFVPTFDQTITIMPDGYVNLRGIGDVFVGGQTVPDFKKSVEGRYSEILREPVISIELKEFQKPYFTVNGEVGKPGKYDLVATTTVTEALAIAGGLTERAKHSQVLIIRRFSEDLLQVKSFNIKSMMRNRSAEDLYLQPGDMVYVPRSFISKVKEFIPRLGLGIGIGY